MDASLLRNKRIGIVGLSVEGLSTLAYFKKHNNPITVYDQRNLNSLPNSVQKDIEKGTIKGYFGNNYLDWIENNDVIVRTPGMPLWDEKLQKAIGKGVSVTSHTKIFFDLCPCPIIGVTGTKGKGTTASLIYEILKNGKKDVFLGGNIGTAPLSFIDSLKPSSFAVLELSSFQLEDLRKSPHISVVLNITSDHLASQSQESPNYHRSHSDYTEAKQHIVSYQKENDFAVLHYDSQVAKQLEKITKAQVWFFSNRNEVTKGAYVIDDEVVVKTDSGKETVCKTNEVSLLGKHNLENVTAAVTVAKILSIDSDVVKNTIKTFKGLEHRLELVRVVNGVTYYNDSFSTVPETAIAAIQSFSSPIILIAGGSEKKSDYLQLGEEIVKGNVKAVILIGETAHRIKEAISKAGYRLNRKLPIIIEGLSSIEDVVKRAQALGKKNDVVLLSPASASFGLFKNYKQRGKLFKEHVAKL